MLILTYHAVESGSTPLCVSPDLFEAHLDVIVASGARAVTISELVEELRSPARERLVALTFDDGFASVAQYAAPLLVARGLTATVFCVAGHLGGRNDWASALTGGFEAALVSTDQVRGLAQAGFEIGSHGFAHVPVAEARGVQQLEQELSASREALERLTGTPVRSYAYPYGALPNREARRLVEQTYVAACTTRVALVGPRPDVHELPRVDAHYLRRPELLKRALEGSLGSYLAARRLGSRARRALRKDYVTA
ncbi:MAG: polysaccharide deacetylase family protein [Actinobacteria bacterium]|nr:polysaccharide deacetylase family protein [Actinomycetota bacterium]